MAVFGCGRAILPFTACSEVRLLKGKSFELFIDGCVDRRVEFVAKRVVNAGYAGRN